MFQVAAVNNWGIGETTKKVNVTLATVPSFNLKVRITNITDTSLTVKWTKDSDAIGYIATLQDITNLHDDHRIRTVKLDKTGTHADFHNLCSGLVVRLGVQALYPKDVKGQMYHSVTTLSGTLPRVQIDSFNMTGSTSAIISYSLSGNVQFSKQFTIFYSTRALNRWTLISPKQVNTSDPHSFELHNLLACEVYFVTVSIAGSMCPPSPLTQFATKPDELAAPKYLRGHLIKGKKSYDLNLTWSAPCYIVPRPVKYEVDIYIGRAASDPVSMLTEKSFSKSAASYLLPSVISGQTYKVKVRTNIAGAQPSDPFSITIRKLRYYLLFSLFILWLLSIS